MMKKSMIATMIMVVFGITITIAQDGIHFQQLTWNEILAKAKAEHKYIFVDCYATWCGPCKQMDANVYPVKEVGEVYNEDFFSVKIQMDRTKADDSLTKSNYKTAKMLEEGYNVNAYPTFLFFDPDGKPAHKATGGLDEKQFIALADEARNPDKQYYTILKNFQPGKLDTTEEKSLARTFNYTDHILGANLALDYLNHIPKQRLRTYASGQLIYWYQDNPTVIEFVVHYLHSLSKKEFASLGTLNFMLSLYNQQRIRQMAIDYISRLSNKEIGEDKNLEFITRFPDDSTVKQVAKKFITEMPDQSIKSKSASWYHYLVYNLKDERYWPQLVDADMDRLAKFADQPNLTASQAIDINNTCDADVFLHSNDTVKMTKAIKWMKKIVDNFNPNFFDTYAGLLYKTGKADEAIAVQQKILEWCIANKAKGTYNRTKHTNLAIEEMKAGKKIWLEKEFQD